MNTEKGKQSEREGETKALSRRGFIGQSALYGGTFLAMVNLPRPCAFAAAEASSKPVTLNRSQWATVEALTARIIPTDQEPGAVEANCVNFIDKALASEDAAQKPVYEKGLRGLDTVARKRFRKRFISLAETQQDEVMVSLQTGEASEWPGRSGSSSEFFETVRAHTIIGFLADPKYGGNRGYAGWKVIGYPGPSHHSGGYTPEQLVGEEPIRPVWEQSHH